MIRVQVPKGGGWWRGRSHDRESRDRREVRERERERERERTTAAGSPTRRSPRRSWWWVVIGHLSAVLRWEYVLDGASWSHSLRPLSFSSTVHGYHSCLHCGRLTWRIQGPALGLALLSDRPRWTAVFCPTQQYSGEPLTPIPLPQFILNGEPSPPRTLPPQPYLADLPTRVRPNNRPRSTSSRPPTRSWDW